MRQSSRILLGEYGRVRAQQHREVYQRQHDLLAWRSQTAGIDPISRGMWFGISAKEIVTQRKAKGITIPLYSIQVGSNYYLHKRSHQC
jgi:hypothetical protein